MRISRHPWLTSIEQQLPAPLALMQTSPRDVKIPSAKIGALLLSTGLSLVWLLAALFFGSPSASAHGSIENPPSRVYNCYKELTTQTLSPACLALLAEGGAQQLYDWNGVRQGNANGQHRTIIPDGQLCSGGSAAFRGLDLARTDWVASPIIPDANGNFEFVLNATAPHATQAIEFYVTNDGHDPTKPLAWSDLGATPFCISGGVPLTDSRYRITCKLPTGKTGKHVIYNIWQRSDSPEAFYSCIDVNFGGAPSTPTTPSTPAPTATPTAGADGCTAAAWSAPVAYVAETLVAHNGHTWRAKWWTQGEEPGTTGQWGVWEDRGACNGSSTPTPTATPLPATATAVATTPTATAPGNSAACPAAAWERTAIYVADNLVAHNGHTWRAKWWTQGEEPGTTGQWGVWEDRGACSGGTPPAPTPTTVAPTATSIAPTATPLPPTATSMAPTATPLAPTATPTSSGSCTAPVWSAAAVYVADSLVSYGGHSWRAKWWTQGETPGTTGQWGVWEDRGVCSGGTTPTATPTTVAATPTMVASPTATSTGQPATGNNTVVAYFTQWGIYQRNYHVKNIATSGSASKINVINYAFGNIVNGRCIMTTQAGVMDAYADYQRSYSTADSVDGVADRWDQPLRGNFNQLKKLKALYPGLKVVISLGGWTWSKGFSDAALTPASRATVVQSCIDLYIKGNLPVVDNAGGVGAAAGVFDGIDIDWEYPAAPGDVGHIYRPEDTQNYTLLLAEFRRQLDAINPNLLLTVATPAGQATYSKMQLAQIHPYLNWINIMSYDLHGTWETTTNFHAHLRLVPGDTTGLSVQSAVQGYLAAGVPANKLIVGIPFYGRGWSGVRNQNNGLYQPAGGAAPGTYEAGFEDYKVLKARVMPSFRDPVTGGFWLYDGNIFWSYDDPQVIAEKMAWLKNLGLRGAMIWSLDGDDATGTLANAVYSGLQAGAAATGGQVAVQAYTFFLPVVKK